MIPVLVMGATGRIGQVLRRQWPAVRSDLHPLWQARKPAAGWLGWDILREPCPEGAACGVVLCLAGVVRGSTQDLAMNVDLAMAAFDAARRQGARHVFLASSAAVYGASKASHAEDEPANPPGAYGAAKLAMERAALDWQNVDGPGLTILRIGNIAGLDALLGGLQPGKAVTLDPVSGQSGGPARSYIGPVTLAAVLARLVELAAQGVALPSVLNIAAPSPVSMGALLDAAGADWANGAENPAVIPRVELNTELLQGLVDLPPEVGQPAVMVAEWRGLSL